MLGIARGVVGEHEVDGRPDRQDPGRLLARSLIARGLLNRLFTRAYVPGEQLAGDPLLASLPAERRRTLIASHDEHGLRFDIRLQGPDQTVFLRYPAQPR